MKLEQQVCSLELAKRLKELGVKQESLFWWSDHTSPATLWREDALMEATADILISDLIFSAFTIAELGEMLPPGGFSYLDAEVNMWKMYAHDIATGAVNKVVKEYTEANARAVMLIYLVENKLIALQ